MIHPGSRFYTNGSTLTLDDSGPADRATAARGRHSAPAETPHAHRQQVLALLHPESTLWGQITRTLENQGYVMHTASCARSAVEQCRALAPDVVIVDETFTSEDHLLVNQLRSGHREVQIILIHQQPDGDGHASTLTHNGNNGTIEHENHPQEARKLERMLNAPVAVDLHEQRTAAATDSDQGPARPTSLPQRAHDKGFGMLIGTSDQMLAIYQMIEKVGPTDATVFLAGESGTGKELVAEAIHQHSRGANKPFVALNCGAIPETLIDSELFGHEKGAFTGATRARGGVFEQANGGTLFLDEITEMPIDLQARLLRVLETGRVHRVGSERDVPVNVRVIAASNRPAAEALEQDRLREDLLYRLSVFPISLPPLRERGEDAVVLANHFLAALNEEASERKCFSEDAIDLIRAYHWPGNVRQVKHAVHRAFILADGGIIEARYLPNQMNRQPTQTGDTVRLEVGTSIAEAERQLIHATLEHFSGDKRRAAEVLGMSLRTLYNRLNIYKAQTRGGRNGRGRHTDQAEDDQLFT